MYYIKITYLVLNLVILWDNYEILNIQILKMLLNEPIKYISAHTSGCYSKNLHFR